MSDFLILGCFALKHCRKQVRALGKYFTFSFCWGFFQWFFTAGNDCGFTQFPTFGLKARDQRYIFELYAFLICQNYDNLMNFNFIKVI